MILADNCFDQFFEYANGTKLREGGVIELIVGRPKLMNLGRKSSAPKESPKPASSSSVPAPRLFTQWKEKGFKQEFVKKRTVKQRTTYCAYSRGWLMLALLTQSVLTALHLNLVQVLR